jgi:riboflavin synthase
MFTGIIEELGSVRTVEPRRLTVSCRTVIDDSLIGASVSVNGTCLTVVERGDGCLGFDLSEETLARTGLARLAPGDGVNLERPVTLATRLGGHLVQGHVDGVGEVVGLEPAAEGATLEIRIPSQLERYVVEKGSITLDGVSLTVATVHDRSIGVALIPHTLAATTLGTASPGDPVNVEVDVIAKYVERLQRRQEEAE